jgi:hypothetical protein
MTGDELLKDYTYDKLNEMSKNELLKIRETLGGMIRLGTNSSGRQSAIKDIIFIIRDILKDKYKIILNNDYESDYGDNNGNNSSSTYSSSTYSNEEERANAENLDFIRNHKSPKSVSKRRKAPKKTYRFKALNRYKAKPKTRRHRR